MLLLQRGLSDREDIWGGVLQDAAQGVFVGKDPPDILGNQFYVSACWSQCVAVGVGGGLCLGLWGLLL